VATGSSPLPDSERVLGLLHGTMNGGVDWTPAGAATFVNERNGVRLELRRPPDSPIELVFVADESTERIVAPLRAAKSGGEISTLDKRLQKLWAYVDRNFRSGHRLTASQQFFAGQEQPPTTRDN
jgi:hypothetical protein